ncbi:uncharacterized protein LOC117167852 [Belonocnema kinseyi]|uniref:uncharacterized protein LOC117167852 n=1 Tax=Belonocnema kinseyi TaxID=2817044 RepID=UPI00143D5D65|nr:uncharacterized protein LOC117167852 [Belonocnema kinseyi]
MPYIGPIIFANIFGFTEKNTQEKQQKADGRVCVTNRHVLRRVTSQTDSVITLEIPEGAAKRNCRPEHLLSDTSPPEDVPEACSQFPTRRPQATLRNVLGLKEGKKLAGMPQKLRKRSCKCSF